MALEFATGKSSQAFAVELLRSALPEIADSLRLGAPDDWRGNYQRVFAELTRLEAGDGAIAKRLLKRLHELVTDVTAVEARVLTVRLAGAGQPVELSTIGKATSAALLVNQLAEPGIAEPLEAFDALGAGQLNPAHKLISIGANAELSLAPEWLSVGGSVIAIARPNAAKWQRLIEFARASAGSLVLPVMASRGRGLTEIELQKLPSAELAALAGLDLETELESIQGWLDGLVAADQRAKFVALATVYAGGSRQILVATAADAILARLMNALPNDRLALGWLATPLDSIKASAELLAARESGYANRSAGRRIRDSLLKLIFGGPLAPQRTEVLDFSVARQGSSYLLAKRIERWRSMVARAAGFQTWFQVAPPAVTVSTVGHKFVRAAYRGATKFGITSFEPWMLRDLLTASLLGTLASGKNLDESAAIHGGVWRSPYAPGSFWLPATILGWPALI